VGEDVSDTELTQPPFRGLVASRDQTDHRHPGDREPGQRIAVQPPQVRGQDDGAGEAGRRRGEQIREVDAPAHDRHPVIAAPQRRDQIRLPPGVRNGGQHGYAGQGAAVLPALVGRTPEGATGTRARSMVPLSTAWTTERTMPLGTDRTTDSVAVPENPLDPES
jgi:hypothetical protein